jgi:hypothetical protein
MEEDVLDSQSTCCDYKANFGLRWVRCTLMMYVDAEFGNRHRDT